MVKLLPLGPERNRFTCPDPLYERYRDRRLTVYQGVNNYMLFSNRCYRKHGILGLLLSFADLYRAHSAIIVVPNMTLAPPGQWKSVNGSMQRKGNNVSVVVKFEVSQDESNMVVDVDSHSLSANVTTQLIKNINQTMPAPGSTNNNITVTFVNQTVSVGNYTLTMVKKFDAHENNYLNTLYLNVTRVAETSSLPIMHGGSSNSRSEETSPPISMTQISTIVASSLTPLGVSSASSQSTETHPSKSSGGEIAGAILGTIFGVLFIVFVLFTLYRHKKRSSILIPDPLTIEKGLPLVPSPTHRFGMHSDRLPRFIAPPSIWPPSTRRNSLAAFIRPKSTDASLPAKITPYDLPAPTGQHKKLPPLAPVPPNKVKRSFFVANQPSQSSRSDTSQSLKNGRERMRDSAPPILSPTPTTPKNIASPVEQKPEEKRRLDKGKQRAVGTEWESRRRRARRSIRRLFVTTNPNPPSSASTSSTLRSKTIRRTAAFVKEQARLNLKSKQPQETGPQPVVGPLRRPLPPAPVAHRPLPTVKGSPPALPTPLPQPRGNLVNQTKFYTTNPSSSHAPSDGQSLASEPRPRLDKGKGRAY